ncbi:MAG TPA: XdhC family protein [Acidimicrobiales bacterium]|nr:XdhC family protein [Acidimicrobiales bacterium]
MEDLAEEVRRRAAVGDDLVIGRVVRVEGFSTLAAGLVVVDGDGGVQGGVLAALAGQQLAQAARRVLVSPPTSPIGELTVDIGDKEAVAAGLACGGRVELVLQAAAAIPSQLWDSLVARAPVAMLTRMPGQEAAVVCAGGRAFGQAMPDELLACAHEALRAGVSSNRVVEQEGSRVLLEAWVPEPRLVVIGGGELLDAIRDQAALLGWETRGSDGLTGLDGLLDWSGQSAALIVLSHDPHIDVPALASGLTRGIAYVGALGSRRTQSRRVEQLTGLGVEPSDLARMHRPIGLDLGGRRAPEVALAIVAEVLACHYGRSAKPLLETSGPIHG